MSRYENSYYSITPPSLPFPGSDLDNDIKYCTVNLSVSHVVATTGADAHSRESVQDLLYLLVSGGGVYLDVRIVHQHVVKVRNLQTQPVLAE